MPTRRSDVGRYRKGKVVIDMSSINRRAAALVIAVVATFGTVIGLAGPASAEGSQDCNTNSMGICLYYNSNEYGARIKALGDVWDYAINEGSAECNGALGCPPYYFSWSGSHGSNGLGVTLKNHAASACYEAHGSTLAKIYFNSGHLGNSDQLNRDGQCINLVHTYNNNASQTMI